MLEPYLKRLRAGENLGEAEARNCLDALLDESPDDETAAAVLVALADKGETAAEITGFAQGMLARAVALDLAEDSLDLCGTGGSGLDRFNVSTTAAFVLAAGGVPVAKHGNRGSRIPNGSFDLLESLDCPFELDPAQNRALFEKHSLCFVYGRRYHPALAKMAPVRRLASRRTVFNLAAPLCNPATPAYQVVGTVNEATAATLVPVLQALGRSRALVVVGEPGIDEVSLAGRTRFSEISPDGVRTFGHMPDDFGLQAVPYEALPGGDYRQNRETFLELMQHNRPAPLLDMVCLNAGAAFYCRGQSASLPAGHALARELFDSGAVRQKFEDFRRESVN